MRSPTQITSTSGFTIGGYGISMSSNSAAFGFIKVDTTSGNPVPVGAIANSIGSVPNGAWVNDVVMDA